MTEHRPSPSTDLIAVGTPQGADGAADLTAVHAVARTIGRCADGDLLVADKSTVPVGTADRVRAATDRQRLPLRARLGVQNARVLSIIELMEANLSEPLSLLEIADHVGLSRRQIERLFRQEMGRSPARYYLEIRLDRARHLLVQSTMPVVEVAIACGFVSASHFSKCYRELYAKSPQQERAERKQLLVA